MKDWVWRLRVKGGPGSGFWGHSGRQGQVGGSAPGTGQRLSYVGHNKPGMHPTPQVVDLADEDNAAYQKAMQLDSEEAKGMLERVGMGRDEALVKVDEGRELAASLPSTRDKYVDEDGNYTPERQALHDKIAASLLAKGQSSDTPTLLLTGGLPGAGKSRMLKQPQYADMQDDLVVIDSDNIKETLAKADGIKPLTHEAASYHAEADDIIATVFSEAIANRYSIGLDGTMKNRNKLNTLVDTFKAKKYRVEVAFADLPVEKAMTRAIGRYLEGGRFVDPAYIATHDHKNLRTAKSLRDRVDVWRQWDTDVPFGAPPKLIEELLNG